jgi:hypothetical protein
MHITGDLTVTFGSAEEFVAALDTVATNPVLTLVDSNEDELWVVVHLDQSA